MEVTLYVSYLRRKLRQAAQVDLFFFQAWPGPLDVCAG
jgi:hypothetical protein